MTPSLVHDLCLPAAPVTGFGWREGWRYGLLGLPLAFCALPLYVLMPNLYARERGVPLAALGAVLLAARLLDAVVDPLLGRWIDRLYARSLSAVLAWGAVAAAALGLGLSALLAPPLRDPQTLLVWALAWLAFTYTAYSALAVAHQAWGAMLGGDAAQRSRIVAWREGLGLAGVVLAATAPALAPAPWRMPVLLALLWTGLVGGLWAWSQAPRPTRAAAATPISAGPGTRSLWHPWRHTAFGRLLAVFMLNGVASAIPATLVLFFVQDRLQGSETLQAAALGLYFVAGALSMPLWLRLVQGLGLARSWLVGMLLSMAVFLAASQVGAGDETLFLWVCAFCGIGLGSDLVLPGAMLAGVIADAGDRGHADASYFGWWNFASKLNLALAAGLALPTLGWLGYVPGTRDPHALQVLSGAYCLLPCALKTMAAVVLYLFFVQPTAVPPSP